MLIRFSPMKLDPKMAVEADIFCCEDGKPRRGPTWPLVDGVAIILCPNCGEIDKDGRFFELNTVYSNLGGPGDNDPDGTHLRCNMCKSAGYMFVGL